MNLSFLNKHWIYLLICFISICNSGIPFAQSWHIVNLDRPLRSIHMLSNNNGWIFDDVISYTTTDGGVNWGFPQIAFTPLVGNGINFFFVDSLYGWSVGGQTSIIRTTNGGSSWSQFLVWWIQATDVFFVNRTTGWVIANESNSPYETVYKSINSGQNWFAQYVTGYEKKPMLSIFMNDESTGWIGMDSGKVAKTTDGGTTWNILNFNNAKKASLIYFKNPNCGWIWLNPGSLLRTTNMGINWSTITMLLPNENVIHATFIDTLIGFVATDNFRLLRTTNGGLNWINVTGGNYGIISNLTFKDQLTGWYVTTDDLILKTTNAGLNWFTQNNPLSGNFNSVYFNNIYTGWIVTNTGLVMKSTNSGINWFVKINISPRNLSSVYFVNSQTGWISGSGDMIMKTTNGGDNWSVINETDLPSKALCFIDEQTGWLAGNNGSISFSTNGGENWIRNNSLTTKNFNSIHFANIYTGIVCGDSGAVYRTTNSGINWFGVSPSVNDNYSCVKFSSADTVFLTGNHWGFIFPSNNYTSQNLFRSTDGGMNWYLVLNNLVGIYDVPLNSISVYNHNYIYVAGKNNYLNSSIDGGNSWTGNISPPLNMLAYNCVYMLNNQQGWVVGDNAAVIVSFDSPIGIIRDNTLAPLIFTLFQNYPNPFNPVTKIKFDVPANVKSQTSNVKLIIYDILGREVTTLVNEALKPGSYEAEWPATGGGSNFASGVYFYSLQTEQFTQTKKMVLMK